MKLFSRAVHGPLLILCLSSLAQAHPGSTVATSPADARGESASSDREPQAPQAQTFNPVNVSLNPRPSSAEVLLDNFDQVEVDIPAKDVPGLSIAFNEYGKGINELTVKKIGLNDSFELSAFNLIFNRVGAPGTKDAELNSFSMVPADLKFFAADLAGGAPFLGLNAFLDPKVKGSADKDPATLDLPNGTVVDTFIYLNFKGQCLKKFAIKTPGTPSLCTSHRLESKGAYISFSPGNDNLMNVLFYDQKPLDGDPPDQFIPIGSSYRFFKKAKNTGAMPVKFFAQ